MRMAASWMGSMPQKRLQRNPSTISPMRTVRKWSFMNQEEGPRQTLKLQSPWSWTSQPPEMWDIIICCLGCPVCSNLNSDMTGLICRYKRGLLFLIWYFFLPHKATAPHSHSMHPGDASTSLPEHPHPILVQMEGFPLTTTLWSLDHSWKFNDVMVWEM